MGAFYLDIKKDLLDKILSGVYQQGSIIPNEYELAEIYNVSRPTIRKAVQILVDEGYLEKRKKRGTIVCDPTIRQEFAQVIQTFDKEVKEKGLTPSTKVLTFKQEKAEEEVRQKLNLKETEKVYKLVRLRYVDDQPMFWLQRMCHADCLNICQKLILKRRVYIRHFIRKEEISHPYRESWM